MSGDASFSLFVAFPFALLFLLPPFRLLVCRPFALLFLLPPFRLLFCLPPVVLFCLPRRLPRSYGVVVIALFLKIFTFLECLTLVYYVALAGSTLSP